MVDVAVARGEVLRQIPTQTAEPGVVQQRQAAAAVQGVLLPHRQTQVQVYQIGMAAAVVGVEILLQPERRMALQEAPVGVVAGVVRARTQLFHQAQAEPVAMGTSH